MDQLKHLGIIFTNKKIKMKLSNQQIDALSSQITNEYREKQQEEIKKLKESGQVKKLAKKYSEQATRFMKLFNALPKKVQEKVKYYPTSIMNEEAFIDASYIELRLVPETIIPADIRNKILVASIDSTDLAQLKEKLDIYPKKSKN